LANSSLLIFTITPNDLCQPALNLAYKLRTPVPGISLIATSGNDRNHFPAIIYYE